MRTHHAWVGPTILSAVLCGAATAQSWQYEGPINSESTYSHSRLAGRTLALAADPGDESTIYAGHASGGLWKCEIDEFGDYTWSCLKDGPIGALYVRSTIQPPNPPGCYFIPPNAVDMVVGTGEWTGYPTFMPGDGIWTSSDGGATFQHAVSWPESDHQSVSTIAGSRCGKTVYAGTTKGLYLSTDYGVSWTTTPHAFFGASEITDIETHPKNPAVAVASVWDPDPTTSAVVGAYRTTDAGVTWTLISGGIYWQTSTLGRVNFEWSSVAPFTLYARATTTTAGEKVWRVLRSSNAGSSWAVAWDQLGCMDALCSSTGAFTRNAFGVSVIDDDYLLLGAVDLYRSIGTNGSVWTTDTAGQVIHDDIHDVLAVSTGFWIATDGGVYYDDYETVGQPFDLEQSNHRNVGYHTIQFYNIDVEFDVNEDTFVGGGTQDNGSWVNNPLGTSEWRRMGGGDGFWTTASDECPDCEGLSGDDVFYFYVGKTAKVTCDASGSSRTVTSTFKATDIFYDDTDPSIIYYFDTDGDNHGLYRVVDCVPELVAETSFTCDESSFTAGEAIAAGGGAPTRVYGTRREGVVLRFEDDNDDGYPSAITDISSNAPWHMDYVSVSDLVVIPGASVADDVLYVTLGRVRSPFLDNPQYDCGAPDPVWGDAYGLTSHVWKYQSGVWSAAGGFGMAKLPREPMMTVTRDPAAPNTLFVGSLHTVYRSINAGLSWTALDTGLPDVMVHDLVYEPGPATLFAGTHGRGIWSALPANFRDRGEVVETDASARVRRVGNQLELDVSRAANVRMAVYDVRGRRLSVVTDRRVASGTHRFDLATSELAPGVYFVRLLVDGVQLRGQKFIVR